MSKKPALSFRGRLFVFGDLVEAGRLSGRWPQLEADAAEGLRLERAGAKADDAALREAATEFRYAHRLLAAEELRTWLEARSLSSPEWYGVLRRRLIRQETQHVLVDAPAVAGDDVEPILWAEAMVSGTLRAIANELIAWCAATTALAEELDTASIASLHDAHERLVAATATDDAIEAVLREHSIDWMRVDYETLLLRTDGAAREARLCVRDDGQSLAAVASRLDLSADSGGIYLDAADEELAGALLAADAGAVVGPIAEDDGWRLMRVVAKQQPRPDDARLRERARALLMDAEIGRHAAGRVEWHGAL